MHFSHFAGCLIPCIKDNSICLYYIQLPFEDDIRGFTLENFNVNKIGFNGSRIEISGNGLV